VEKSKKKKKTSGTPRGFWGKRGVFFQRVVPQLWANEKEKHSQRGVKNPSQSRKGLDLSWGQLSQVGEIIRINSGKKNWVRRGDGPLCFQKVFPRD